MTEAEAWFITVNKDDRRKNAKVISKKKKYLPTSSDRLVESDDAKIGTFRVQWVE